MVKDLYVLIATAGRATLLERTLDSLVACKKPEVYRATIVVENGPKMGTEAMVSKYVDLLNAQYMHVERANKCHALNEALAKIGDGLVFFTDDDVRFDPQLLEHYAEAAEGVERGCYYGGTCAVDYEKRPSDWLRVLLPHSARGLDLKDPAIASDYSFLGFNWAAFASDILELQGFNTLYGPGSPIGLTVGDETDMQRRLLAANVRRVPVPDAIVWHYVPASRCNLRWALQRRYRHGFSIGLQARPQDETFGVPHNSAKRLTKHARRFLSQVVRFNRVGAANELRHVATDLGEVKGYRTKKRMAVADPIASGGQNNSLA